MTKLFSVVIFAALSFPRPAIPDVAVTRESGQPQVLTSDRCVEIALDNNHLRPASAYAVKAAEAQYRQALSGHWPQVSVSSVYTVMDEPPNFIFPASQMAIPPIQLGGFKLALEPIDVPEQDIRLMDKENWLSSLRMTLPLYTGGLISAYKQQARAGINVAKQEARRTDLQIIYDTKKYYYAAVLTQKLYEIADEALARLEATLELTENLYKNGSGRVKKTDFLQNKVIVENVRSMVVSLRYKKALACEALAFSMGLEAGTSVRPAESEIPYLPCEVSYDMLLSEAFQFNPEWQTLLAALDAYEGKLKQAKSGHLPKIALVGGLNYIENSYNYGMVTPENKQGWVAGIGLELPLFSGFKTSNEVREARARLSNLAEKKMVFKEGLALQLKQAISEMEMAKEKHAALAQALESAVSNRDLVERAYQVDLMEENDLIQSQIIESLMKAQYQNVLYQHYCARAKLEFTVGREVFNEAE